MVTTCKTFNSKNVVVQCISGLVCVSVSVKGLCVQHLLFANPLTCHVTTVDALGHIFNRIGLITAQWEGIGDVGSARYELALLPPCPTIRVLSHSSCQRSTHYMSK